MGGGGNLGSIKILKKKLRQGCHFVGVAAAKIK